MTKQKRKLGVLVSSLALSAMIAGCNGGGVPSSGPSGVGGGGGSVATVNGDSVDRNALHSHLEATNGESALRQLIEFSLVAQKAKAEGVSVSDAEIQEALKERQTQEEASLKSQPGKKAELPAIIKNGGVKLEALQRQIRYELMLNKILTKDVKVTDDQLKKWFETRRKWYGTPDRVKFGFLLSSTKARADTMAAQLKSKSKTFQELVREQQAANDQLAKGSQAELPNAASAEALPANMKAAFAKLKPGESSSVLTLGQAPRQAFAIVRLVSREGGQKPDFAKLKTQLEMDYKLEQVARKLNSENPQNPQFDQTLEQIAQLLAQQSGGERPAFRAILNFINRTQVENMLREMRTAAKVEIKDATYEPVGEEYKQASATPAAGAPGSGAPGGAAPKAGAPGASTPPAGTTPK